MSERNNTTPVNNGESLENDNAAKKSDEADREWIKCTCAELGAEWVPILELCAAHGAALVRRALFEAANDPGRIKSVLGYVRWRAERLRRAADRQRDFDRKRDQRIAAESAKRVAETRAAEEDAARTDERFATLDDGQVADCFLRALSTLDDPLRTRVRDRGPNGGAFTRGLIVDIAEKLGYLDPRTPRPPKPDVPPP